MPHLKKYVVFFEVEGGSDKGPDGHRKDTMPMVNSLKEKGWDAEAIYYSKDKRDELFEYVSQKSGAYVSRVNPSREFDEKDYFDFLRSLIDAGLVGLPHPDDMTRFGAKDALVKLTDADGLELVLPDSFAYYSLEELREHFPRLLAEGERVLKQNRGSTGEGIWRVQTTENSVIKDGQVTLESEIKCTEAVDNHVEIRQLGEFMEFCEQYIVGDNGMVVDMRFLPRIIEGEVRILMVHDRPMFVVHKKPAEAADAFSATLFSGAHYTYEQPDDPKWTGLIADFNRELPEISDTLAVTSIPLIWTADFILDYDEDGNDKYFLSELNCSCVGFTSYLEMAADVADAIIDLTLNGNA